MAASKKEDRIFDCPICFEKFNKPKYLSCLHTFCELCIQTLIESSLSDSDNHENIFLCPVCRTKVEPPFANINAEKWAKSLPLNHQLLSFMDSLLTEDRPVILCDSCKVSDGLKTVAIYRCKQCKDNLCNECWDIIHERIPTYSTHVFIDLRQSEQQKDKILDFDVYCAVHLGKTIEIYCFDHEKLCCSFCLTTEHVKCKKVISLDEIENDLEKPTRSLVNGTEKLKYITKNTVETLQKNIKDLNEKEHRILGDVANKISNIKLRLDSLHLQLKNSIECDNSEQISKVKATVNALEAFDGFLSRSQKITATLHETGSRKEMLIAMMKIKMQMAIQLEGLLSQRNNMKCLKLNWNDMNEMETITSLSRLGNYEYLFHENDLVTPLEMHVQAMLDDIQPMNILGNFLLHMYI